MEREKEYPLYPELTEQGNQQAQDLMNKFEKTLKESATQIMSNITTDFYCDILNEVEGDQWTNYRTKMVNALCDYKNKPHAKYDFDRIRKSIYRNHKEEIVKDLNQDLLAEIEDLKKRIKRIGESANEPLF